MPKRRRRRGRWVWIAVVVAVLAAAVGAWLWRSRVVEKPEPAEVEPLRNEGRPTRPAEEIREGERRALEKLLEEKRSRGGD